MIIAENLYKTYGRGQTACQALRGVNIAIGTAESVAIVGKSGSGKSTLMHILACLDRPTSGNVYWEGKALEKTSEQDLAGIRNQHFGFIFQQFFFHPHLTVVENIALPLKIRGTGIKEREEKARFLLEQVGLPEKANNRPSELSGGQMQRVAIARALIGDPGIIFADEPTGNLDSQTAEQVEDLLFRLHRQHRNALVIVTHDPDLAKLCDRTVYMKDGVLSEKYEN